MSEGRLKVMLIAEAANPEWVSVPLVGWSHCRALMEVVDGHLVTQVRNQGAIERAGLTEGREFTALDTESVARPVWKLGDLLRGGRGKGWTTTTALASLSYYYFEWAVWRRFGARIKRREFDVVHRVTPLSPTIPSVIAGRCARAGVPFVIGPLNGGAPWPKGFDTARRAEKEWLSYVRRLYRLLPGYGATRRQAAAIVAGSRDTLGQMPGWARGKCVYIPENGIDPGRFSARRTRRAGKPLRLVFVGRLVPYKGADMLIEAAAPLIRSGDAVLELIGDGPQAEELRGLIERLGVDRGVTMTGWVKHTELPARLVEHDLFVFPSVREFGGGVALEAMAVGLPAMVMDYAGPAELVTEETGFLIEMGSREDVVARLRAALERLARSPEEIDDRSSAAVERVERLFTWEAKARQTLEVYEWVTGRRVERPDFGMPLREARGRDEAGARIEERRETLARA